MVTLSALLTEVAEGVKDAALGARVCAAREDGGTARGRDGAKAEIALGEQLLTAWCNGRTQRGVAIALWDCCCCCCGTAPAVQVRGDGALEVVVVCAETRGGTGRVARGDADELGDERREVAHCILRSARER